jgi:hypothetical protein
MNTIEPGVTGRSAGSDALLPAKKVQQRYDVSDRTIDRWAESETVGFPRPIVVNRRKYWRLTGEVYIYTARMLVAAAWAAVPRPLF